MYEISKDCNITDSVDVLLDSSLLQHPTDMTTLLHPTAAYSLSILVKHALQMLNTNA